MEPPSPLISFEKGYVYQFCRTLEQKEKNEKLFQKIPIFFHHLGIFHICNTTVNFKLYHNNKTDYSNQLFSNSSDIIQSALLAFMKSLK